MSRLAADPEERRITAIVQDCAAEASNTGSQRNFTRDDWSAMVRSAVRRIMKTPPPPPWIHTPAQRRDELLSACNRWRDRALAAEGEIQRRVLTAFTGHVAMRFITKADMSADDALKYADASVAAHLDMEGIRFGHPDYAWDVDAANEIADEEMSHWEAS